MLNPHERSTRIVVDVQACQTPGSAQRGVGRFSSSLLQAITRAQTEHDVFALAWNHHPVAPELGDIRASRLLNMPVLPEWPNGTETAVRDRLDSELYASGIADLRADVVLISHVFEGFGGRAPLPSLAGRTSGQIFSAILYDLIPLRFPGHYFASKAFEHWYRERLAWLAQADVLLAISNSSRDDAIEFLDLDPSRIAVIHGGISPHFAPTPDKAAARRHLASRYGITRDRFVMYGGGDEFRKNLPGAIAGYAAIPADQRRDLQFVIVCALGPQSNAHYRALCRKAGLADDDVIFTGHVPEEDLVALYGTCDLFVFPSLYEGLGLPVLEAMACGAPVIGSDNSSIREVIDREDAIFDASSPTAIAAAISGVLASSSRAEELREHGANVAKNFTWELAAERSLAAIDEALQRKCREGVAAVRQGWLPRSRLAVLTPLPPGRSGIADYNAAFLPYLAQHFDIDLYVADPPVADATLNATFDIYDVADFPENAQQYDAILYEFGNSEFHAHMLELLKAFPGVVGLHDAFLSGLAGYMDFNLGEQNYFAEEMLRSHGSMARAILAPARKNPHPLRDSLINLPGTKSVIDDAIGLISHSPFNLELARQFYPQGWSAPYRIIPQMIRAPKPASQRDLDEARRHLGYAADDFIVTTFGHVAWNKWGDRLLEAFLASSLSKDPKCQLVFVGALANDNFGDSLEKQIRTSGLADRIRVTGFASREDYERYLRVADAAFQLRGNSRGGTPRGALDCLAHGTPLVVNNDASYRDYPDDVVLKLSPDCDSAEIASALEKLRSDTQARERLKQAGLTYVKEVHDPARSAAQYALAINEFTQRHNALDARRSAPRLAPFLAQTGDTPLACRLAAGYLDGRPRTTFDRRRLLVDVSHTSKNAATADISRVVTQVVKNGYCRSKPGLDTVAVSRNNSSLSEAKDWLAKQDLLLPHEVARPAARIDLRPGDCLLMLDSCADYRQFLGIFEQARAVRVPIVTAIHDLLPPTASRDHHVNGGAGSFATWVEDAVTQSNGIVCPSKSLADEIIGYITSKKLGRKGFKVGYWHLGSDLPSGGEYAEPQASDAPGQNGNVLTWEQSTEALIDVVIGQNWYWRSPASA